MTVVISAQNFIEIYEDHAFLGEAVHNRGWSIIGWPPLLFLGKFPSIKKFHENYKNFQNFFNGI